MKGLRDRTSAGCRVVAAALCVPLAGMLVATGAPAARLAPSAVVTVAAPVPPASPPRIAFTDAEDASADATDDDEGDGSAVTTEPNRPRAVAAPAISSLATVTAHAGETSINHAGRSASISTAEDPMGDVYLAGFPGQDGPDRVTCDNTAIETHPVVSPDGTRVAYASNASGTFRLWLGELKSDADLSCADTTHTLLAGAAGRENLWPAWVGNDRLVFSGTGLDPLGDLWIIDVGSAGSAVFDAPATRLTSHPAAETQPGVGSVLVRDGDGESGDLTRRDVVTLTTTQFQPDGSLGYLMLPVTEASPSPIAPTIPVSSLWDDGTQQSTEGVWSPDSTEIAFTTTDHDPYGDVHRARVAQGADGHLSLDPASVDAISAVPGTAESHVAWLPRLDEYAYQEWRYTRRTASGDVSDVVAADGTGRRTIAGDVVDEAALDESTPTYSPDGSRIAYSRTTRGEDGREIVMADSDGGGVVTLDTGREDGADDVEPSWSPDGTQIAFVRFPGCECSIRPSEIWVADVQARTAHRVTTVPEDTAYWDENPSWSPDGSRLVIARAVEHLQPDLEVWFDGPDTVAAEGSIEVTVHISNDGRGTANGVTVKVTGPAPDGDSPPGVALEPVDGRCAPPEDNVLTCRLGSIAPFGSDALTFRATGELLGTHDLSAVVSVTGTPAESDTGNNTASRRITVVAPDIEVTADPESFSEITEPLEITFTIQNRGDYPATDVVLDVDWAGVDPYAGVVTVTWAEPEDRCDVGESVPVQCRLGTIDPGAPPEDVVVIVSPVESGDVEVTGEVKQVPGEVDVGDNDATVRGNIYLSDCCPEGIASAVPSALLTDPVVTAAATLRAPVSRPAAVREVPDVPPDGSDTTLWVIDPVTGAGHELVGDEPRPQPIAGRGPAWSPDGLRIAYEHLGSVLVLDLADPRGDAVALLPDTGRPVIHVVTGFASWSLEAADPTPSRHLISVAEDPAWSPDGKELAIAAQPAGHPDQRGIYRIAPDGTSLTVVAQGRGPETEPAWQPFTDLAVTLTAVPDTILVDTGSTLTATVTNSGPTGASDVALELAVPAGLLVTAVPVTVAPVTCSESTPGVVSCDVGALAPGGSSAVELPVTGIAVGTHAVRADVGSSVSDPVAANGTATATVDVTIDPPETDVSVTVRMDPDPGYVGGVGTLSVEVTNSDTGTATGIQVTIAHPAAIVALTGTPTCFTGSPCSIGSLAPGDRSILTAPVRFVAEGTGALTASVTSTVTDSTPANDRATRTVTVKQPVVRILQPIGTPGTIAMAVGEQLPPGSQVLLSWDHGLNQREIRVEVAPDGTMPATQVLVFRRDQIGTRVLMATPADPTQYTAVSTPMLVTPRTVTPPADFVSRN